jgi:hypothetical protein
MARKFQRILKTRERLPLMSNTSTIWPITPTLVREMDQPSTDNSYNSTLKVARIGFSEEDIAKNVIEGCYGLLPHLF